jgi:hypothetical protein
MCASYRKLEPLKFSNLRENKIWFQPGTVFLAAVSGPLRDRISISQSARLHNLETSHGIAQEQNIILVSIASLK